MSNKPRAEVLRSPGIQQDTQMNSSARLLVAWALLGIAMPVVVAQPGPKIVRLAKYDGIRAWVAFSPDSKTLAISGGDDHIRLWDVATAKERSAFRSDIGKGLSRLFYVPNRK